MNLISDISRLFSFLLRHSKGMRHSRAVVVFIVVAGAISGLCSTALLALVNAILNENGSFSALLRWKFIGLCLVLPATRFTSQYCLTHLMQRSIYNLRIQLSWRILSAPLCHLEEVGAPRLLAALTGDIPAITNALTALPIVCMHTAVVIGSLFYLGWLSWTVLFIVLSFILLGIATYQVPVIKALHYLRFAREKQDSLFDHFRALTEGTKELKLHRQRRTAFFSQILEPTARSLWSHSLVANVIYAAASSWGQVLFFVLIGLLLFVVPTWNDINSQILIGYTLVILYMMTPLEVILNSFPVLSQATVAVKKVEELGLLLATDVTRNGTPVQPKPDTPWGRLELKGVTHTYYREKENRRFTLGPIDLILYPEELVFLIGGNGSGKTTLAKLLTGLYVPETGELWMNGEPITDANRENYHQYFSVVFSDFYLFESLLGLDTAKLDAEARKYLIQLQLDHKVQVQEGVLSTTDLSRGQRRRLALLTAYLEDRPIYVFDEWAADQDPVFKKIFYLQLLPELKNRGKIVLVISHDEQYYHVADRIIKLDYGNIYYDKQVAHVEDNSTENASSGSSGSSIGGIL